MEVNNVSLSKEQALSFLEFILHLNTRELNFADYPLELLIWSYEYLGAKAKDNLIYYVQDLEINIIKLCKYYEDCMPLSRLEDTFKTKIESKLTTFESCKKIFSILMKTAENKLLKSKFLVFHIVTKSATEFKDYLYLARINPWKNTWHNNSKIEVLALEKAVNPKMMYDLLEVCGNIPKELLEKRIHEIFLMYSHSQNKATDSEQHKLFLILNHIQDSVHFDECAEILVNTLTVSHCFNLARRMKTFEKYKTLAEKVFTHRLRAKLKRPSDIKYYEQNRELYF